jgi:hypothetical protein
MTFPISIWVRYRTGMLYRDVKRAVEPLGVFILVEASRNQEYFAGGMEGLSQQIGKRSKATGLFEREARMPNWLFNMDFIVWTPYKQALGRATCQSLIIMHMHDDFFI